MPRLRWRTSIFQLGEARGWTGAELAVQLGINPSTLWRWDHGLTTPSTTLQRKCARLFQRSTDELFWQEEEPLLAEVAS